LRGADASAWSLRAIGLHPHALGTM
jgi:hypothetical protein